VRDVPDRAPEPGVVEQHSGPLRVLLHLGRYPSGVDGRAGEVAQAFRDAGFLSEPTPDIMRWKYRKLIMNLGNAIQAVCGLSGTEEIVAHVREEGEAILARAGIDVASREEDRRQRGEASAGGRHPHGRLVLAEPRPRHGSIEADYLNGEIVLLDAWPELSRHGTSTPVDWQISLRAKDFRPVR
jgi:2-dehydropantoate 2-reductase